MRRATGTFRVTHYEREQVRAYIPLPLPPEPPLDLTPHRELQELATLALGRLDALGFLIPDLPLFIYFYIRKEAVLSSQIEGTQSSMADLLLFENDQQPGVPAEDVEEVSNYVHSLLHGVERMRTTLPLSLRLLQEMHGLLLRQGRGSEKQPGEFRSSQNWIGGSRPGNAMFVPPPPEELMNCLDSFEKFIHADMPGISPLIKAALAHVQFETIHPFLDGNGRLGRQLITLMLCSSKVLQEPVLYLSLYFKQNREQYYNLLQSVRVNGNWEDWVAFYLEGIRSTAENASATAKTLVKRFEDDRKVLSSHKKSAGSLLRMHELLKQRPIWQAPKLATALGLSVPGTRKLIDTMLGEGILREISGKQRYQVYCYQKYMDILNEGTEPLARST